MMDNPANTELRRRVAWLGLAVIVCMVLGAVFGTLLADALGVARWIGYIAGFGLGYLLARTLLRRFFSRNL